jgi:type 1 glutamine amidotransferase
MKTRYQYLVLCVISAWGFLGGTPGAIAQQPKEPIRVLVLTGRNNHSWQETTPKLQQILETTGGFHVDTTVPPAGLTRENLARYDVILSNWNSWGSGSAELEAEWTPEVRAAYLDFVREGKGHVTVHAGGSSFYEGWPEYQQVALVNLNLTATTHGPQHEFAVRIDRADHPLTSGMRQFTMLDELWVKPGVVPQAVVLASAWSGPENGAARTDQWEPSAVSAPFGKGRCFATLLGHDAAAMDNSEFQTLLVRGVRWAAAK